MNGATVCARDRCGHIRTIHPQAKRCLTPNCSCDEFVTPVEDADEARVGVRRVCVDVPDGYSLTISLDPVQPATVTGEVAPDA